MDHSGTRLEAMKRPEHPAGSIRRCWLPNASSARRGVRPRRPESQQGRDGGDPDPSADGDSRRGLGTSDSGENRRAALTRLRIELALNVRSPVAQAREERFLPRPPVAIAMQGRADRRQSRARGFPGAVGRGAGCASCPWRRSQARGGDARLLAVSVHQAVEG